MKKLLLVFAGAAALTLTGCASLAQDFNATVYEYSRSLERNGAYQQQYAPVSGQGAQQCNYGQVGALHCQ